VLIKEPGQVGLEISDLAPPGSVLDEEVGEPSEPVPTRRALDGGGVDVFQAAEAGLDLAVGAELVPDRGGELGQLILDVMKGQRAQADQGAAVFEHRFDLSQERVVGLQGLDRAQGRFGQQRSSGGQ